MTARARYPRSTCCVIGCRHTSTLFEGEWVCGEHWRLVDRDLKALRTKLMRRRRKRWAVADAAVAAARAVTQANKPAPDRYRPEDIQREVALGRAKRRATAAFHRTDAALWRRMKRQAIERAVGISA